MRSVSYRKSRRDLGTLAELVTKNSTASELLVICDEEGCRWKLNSKITATKRIWEHNSFYACFTRIYAQKRCQQLNSITKANPIRQKID
jgi:hypothetical protein